MNIIQMSSKYQQGALNLVWVAIGSALLASVAMATLYSLRYERNVFAEGFAKVSGKLQDTKRAAETVTGTGSAAPIYQCNVNGKILYSNVACDAKSTESKKVDIQDTRGFEAPKVPVEEPVAGNLKQSLEDKIIERAVQGR